MVGEEEIEIFKRLCLRGNYFVNDHIDCANDDFTVAGYWRDWCNVLWRRGSLHHQLEGNADLVLQEQW